MSFLLLRNFRLRSCDLLSFLVIVILSLIFHFSRYALRQTLRLRKSLPAFLLLVDPLLTVIIHVFDPSFGLDHLWNLHVDNVLGFLLLKPCAILF